MRATNGEAALPVLVMMSLISQLRNQPNHGGRLCPPTGRTPDRYQGSIGFFFEKNTGTKRYSSGGVMSGASRSRSPVRGPRGTPPFDWAPFFGSALDQSLLYYRMSFNRFHAQVVAVLVSVLLHGMKRVSHSSNPTMGRRKCLLTGRGSRMVTASRRGMRFDDRISRLVYLLQLVLFAQRQS